MGDVLDAGGDVWPTAGRFLLSGESAVSVERDMERIVNTYTLTTKAGD
ncbi:hypothetical protein GQS52_16080 [Streptomyces sp. SCUT-3]|nr:hypothetical protein [Streptomyces sp. SCUT-3]QMV23042.1 hypothetical protein GQS52_16080 [Streptomyces sp. SCUT-3]